MRTGVREIDDAIGELVPGRVTVIAGEAGSGKLDMAASIAKGAADSGAAVAYLVRGTRLKEVEDRMAGSPVTVIELLPNAGEIPTGSLVGSQLAIVDFQFSTADEAGSVDTRLNLIQAVGMGMQSFAAAAGIHVLFIHTLQSELDLSDIGPKGFGRLPSSVILLHGPASKKRMSVIKQGKPAEQ